MQQFAVTSKNFKDFKVQAHMCTQTKGKKATDYVHISIVSLRYGTNPKVQYEPNVFSIQILRIYRIWIVKYLTLIMSTYFDI